MIRILDFFWILDFINEPRIFKIVVFIDFNKYSKVCVYIVIGKANNHSDYHYSLFKKLVRPSPRSSSSCDML